MNIFRSKYRMIKEKLRAFGEQIKGVNTKARHTAAFWQERLNRLNNELTWEYVITAYLAYSCTDEEIRFIDCVLIRGQTIVLSCGKLHLSERESYYWCETIYKDLVGMAVETGLLALDFMKDANVNAEVACCKDCSIDKDTWLVIEKLVANHTKYKSRNLRSEIEAMLLISDSKLTWRELPKRYGSWKTIYNKYNAWRKSGLWERIKNLLNKKNNSD